MKREDNIKWKVTGMDCPSCALTINKYLEKEGMKNVKVNFATGDVSFSLAEPKDAGLLAKGILGLGYKVMTASNGDEHAHNVKTNGFFKTNMQRFWVCLPFTFILLLHMLPGMQNNWLMQPWMQFALCTPVLLIGMSYFGMSAIKSIRNGMPNMNVLVTIGALAAFVYSLYGGFTHQHQFIFYETTATIITLVFLGNYLEEYTVTSTQAQLKKLVQTQVVMANMIAYDHEHKENIFPVESSALRMGDLILIKTGEQVPADCKILTGEASINEAIITGESVPVQKRSKDKLIGGSVLVDGIVRAQVTAVGDDTVLAGIVNMVNEAQGEKPPVQQLADKISAIFVPVVVGIAILTLLVNWMLLGDFTASLMRAIGVLVIACPCAMGLATPAAIAVGLGRGARNGILFRNATSLENFKNIRQVVFDKTGTLTTGNFVISDYAINDPGISDEEFKRLVFSLEKYSNHPLAKSITSTWRSKNEIRWKNIKEEKGKGMIGVDADGNEYKAVSYATAAAFTTEEAHNIYVIKNQSLIGTIDLADELRPEARAVVRYFHQQNIRTILLSGDRHANVQSIAKELGIDEVIAEKTPEEKLQVIAQKNTEAPTAMVGDGINDAPALAKATIGISMSEASQIAMQTAQVVLMNNGIKQLPMALGLGKHTYQTIKENLFWAFAYNIVAIPVAALGFLTPIFGALVMAFSDVVLTINSGRLLVKKVV